MKGARGGLRTTGMNITKYMSKVPEQLSQEMTSLDRTWKTQVDHFMNHSQPTIGEPNVRNSSVANLLLLQMFFLLILATSWCCYHPCMASLPCNCYNPLRFNMHASWMHRVLRLVRETIFFALVLGVLILASVDDCSRRVTHMLCKAGDEQSLLRQALIWLTFGVVCVTLRELCGDSPFCSEAARLKDVDERLLHLRRGSGCCTAFCNRATQVTGVVPTDGKLDVIIDPEEEDEEGEEDDDEESPSKSSS